MGVWALGRDSQGWWSPLGEDPCLELIPALLYAWQQHHLCHCLLFPCLLSHKHICPHGQAWRELLASYTTLNPLQLALYLMRASSFSS